MVKTTHSSLRRNTKGSMSVINLVYTPFIGFPLCVICMTLGCIFCCTIVGLPVGFALFALGNKVLTLQPRPRYM